MRKVFSKGGGLLHWEKKKGPLERSNAFPKKEPASLLIRRVRGKKEGPCEWKRGGGGAKRFEKGKTPTDKFCLKNNSVSRPPPSSAPKKGGFLTGAKKPAPAEEGNLFLW